MMNTEKQAVWKELLSILEQASRAGTLLEHVHHMQRLEKDALQENAVSVLAAVQLYGALLSYRQRQMEQADAQLGMCMMYAQEAGEHYYVMRASNLMGLIAAERGEYFSALPYYLRASHISKEHPQFGYDYAVLTNLGNLFVWMNEYDVAASYLEQAYGAYTKSASDVSVTLSDILAGLVEVYTYLQDTDKRLYWREKCFAALGARKQRLLICFDLLNSAIVAAQQGDLSSMQEAAHTFLQHCNCIEETVQIFRALLRLWDVVMEQENFPLAQAVCAQVEKLEQDASLRTFYYAVADKKLQYAKRFSQQTNLAPVFEAYYRQSKNTVEELRRTYLHSLLVTIELDKSQYMNSSMQRKNAELQRSVETDVFTGLYNKVSTEAQVQKCMEVHDGRSWQIMMALDIDTFKSVNDFYGHTFGDVIIATTATLLSEMDYPEKIVGRFGGDEFLVFFNEVANLGEVIGLVKELMAKVHLVSLPDGRMGRLSYSMGMVASRSFSSFADGFKAADGALYTAKGGGRDCAVLLCEGDTMTLRADA